MSYARVCGLDASLAVVGGKWKPLILFHLAGEPKRFGEIKKLVVGISEKVLIQQLRELAAFGVLTRRDHHQVPPMVDYTLTDFGKTLAKAIMPLCEWGTEHRQQIEKVIRAGNPTAAARSPTD
ncbi:helix-turn-helix domain-containing protein [Sphingomonas sp. DG1-23]|uniref:winged helix-turn-helix transcriptional regulator n=1 Tax=Sphingomonas sp. DG1-23 TaxID=3068316 RepID=UPI00273F98A3|nr:helix-turn-helix domain-containing protein [Sphingomonas sp. DG1-23]MDP5277561.1 helix-turn-helix domain-containing protein [Sphingomonas sp. DG1-23]